MYLARVGDDDSLQRGITRTFGNILNSEDDVQTLQNLSEDDVLVVQPAGENGANEELRAWNGISICFYDKEERNVPFVSLPALAIERVPAPACLSLKFSSANLSP